MVERGAPPPPENSHASGASILTDTGETPAHVLGPRSATKGLLIMSSTGVCSFPVGSPRTRADFSGDEQVPALLLVLPFYSSPWCLGAAGPQAAQSASFPSELAEVGLL